MKKYVIKNADGSEQNVMPAAHDTRKEAMLTILRYATESVEDGKDDCSVGLLVDYMVEKVEEDDACECIPDFVSAIAFLQARDLLHKEIRPCDFLGSLNPKHFEALDALNKLFTIAQAWNIMDGFVPDFSNRGQEKWFPWFTYEKATERFVFSSTVYTPASAFANIGSRLCFKTQERAEQFGKQFADLYNKVFL
jgi:hypothetical protein